MVTKILSPGKEVLEPLVHTHSTLAISLMFNVGRTLVRKWMKQEGIPNPRQQVRAPFYDITKEELESMLSTKTLSTISEECRVSKHTVASKMDEFGIKNPRKPVATPNRVRGLGPRMYDQINRENLQRSKLLIGWR